MNEVFAAADIGGTKIRAGLFTEDLSLLHCVRLPSNATFGRDALLQTLAQALQTVIDAKPAQLSLAGIGISTAGVVDTRSGTIVDATDAIPDWRDTPLKTWLQQRFAVDVTVENDVKAALVGEMQAVPRLQKGRVVMLALGTGLGGAIADAGRLVAGHHSVAGHFGRMPMPSPWHLGETVTLELLVSGTGLARVANAQPVASSSVFSDGRAVLQALVSGNAQARAGVDQFCRFLAMALEQIAWALDPDHIVLGGGLVEAREHWWRSLEQCLAECPLSLSLLPAQLNNDAGMVGAAALAHSHANSHSRLAAGEPNAE